MNAYAITEVEDEVDEENASDELEFPCLILEGVTTFPELKFLVERRNKTDTILRLYVKFEDVIKRITSLDFSLDVLQLLHSINPNYKLTFCKSDIEQINLDLNSAETYIKLLQIK